MTIRHNRSKAARHCEASGRGCCTGSGDVTETAQSCVWNSAPIIHPLAPISAGDGVCQLVSIEVTLSCRDKNSPFPAASENTKSCRDCGTACLFAMPQMSTGLGARFTVIKHLGPLRFKRC